MNDLGSELSGIEISEVIGNKIERRFFCEFTGYVTIKNSYWTRDGIFAVDHERFEEGKTEIRTIIAKRDGNNKWQADLCQP